MRSPSTEPVAHERERQAVRQLEDLRVLLAHAGEVVDVEEAPVAAGLRVDVEELRAQLGVGPAAVRVVGRHVVRDDVEHDPQARPRAPRATSARNSSSPPSSSEIRVGSTTS